MTLFSRIDKLLGNNQIKSAIDEFQRFIANCPGGNEDLQGDLDKVSTSLIILSSKFSDLSEKLNSNTIAPEVADREKATIINSLVQIKSQMRFNNPELFKYILEKDEESAWQDALHNNTIDGYQDYFSKYPNGKYKEDSIRFIKQLREKREAQDNEIRKIAEQEKVRRESIETKQVHEIRTEDIFQQADQTVLPATVKSKKSLFLIGGILVLAAIVIFLLLKTKSSPEIINDSEVLDATTTDQPTSTTNTGEVKTPEEIKNQEVQEIKPPVEPVIIKEPFSIYKVTWVEYKTFDGNKTGTFKLTGDKKWAETNSDGSFLWQEWLRDEWSIYLVDPSRNNMNLRLDFFLKGVLDKDAKYYIITDYAY